MEFCFVCGWGGLLFYSKTIFLHLKRSPTKHINLFMTLCSGAFLVAHMVKNLLEMRETQVRSLAGEDPLEKGMATHSSILAWIILWQRSLASYSPWCCKESDMTEQLNTHKDLLIHLPTMIKIKSVPRYQFEAPAAKWRKACAILCLPGSTADTCMCVCSVVSDSLRLYGL